MSWIVIHNWGEFQHYKNRDPSWIKNYVQLLHNDDYLGLTWQQRGTLHFLLLEYAASDGRLPDDTAALSRRAGDRVTRATLEALNEAGWIKFSASKPPRLHAKTEKRREEQRREETPLRLAPREQDEQKQREEPAAEEAAIEKAKPPAAKKPRERDELWDALAEELGEPETRSERGRRNKALKELRDIGVEANEVRHRIRSYRRKWPDIELTATALVANWSSLANGTFRPEPNFRCEVCGFGSITELRMNEHKANVHGLEVTA